MTQFAHKKPSPAAMRAALAIIKSENLPHAASMVKARGVAEIIDRETPLPARCTHSDPQVGPGIRGRQSGGVAASFINRRRLLAPAVKVGSHRFYERAVFVPERNDACWYFRALSVRC